MSYKNIITWAKINQIRLWEPLETQTIKPKKYMKYATECGYAGQMLPILIYLQYRGILYPGNTIILIWNVEFTLVITLLIT